MEGTRRRANGRKRTEGTGRGEDGESKSDEEFDV
jgi:hypothetical protein